MRPSPAPEYRRLDPRALAACSSPHGRPTLRDRRLLHFGVQEPRTDTFKAIFYSGLLCMLLFILVPFTFQGVLGLNGMLATPIVDGSGVADALARHGRGGALIHSLLVMLMILAWCCAS